MKFMSAVAVQEYDATRVKRWTLWSGRILSAFGVFILASSITAKLTHYALYVAAWERLGYAESILTGVGFSFHACTPWRDRMLLVIATWPKTKSPTCAWCV